MTQFFLEDTIPLLLVVVLTVVVLGIVWYRLQTPGALRAWIAGTLIGILLLVVGKLVVTDREAIEITVRRLGFAVESADVPTIAASLDESYAADTLTKDELIALIEAAFQQIDVSNARLDLFEIEVDGDRGSAIFRAFCRLRSRLAEQPVISRWKLTLTRREKAWRVTAIVPLEFNNQKVDGLREVMGMRPR